MEKEHGGTTCSSSGCGAASNTRRYICGPTKALAKRGTRSAVTSTSIIAAVHIRALTATHRIKPTSTRCQSAWWLNLGRCSTYRRGDSVQTAGTSSHAGPSGVLFIGPVIQPIDLFVKLRWERLDPRSKFFSDELLQDLREGIALAEILIPSRFVNERNYSDSSKPMLQLRRAHR